MNSFLQHIRGVSVGFADWFLIPTEPLTQNFWKKEIKKYLEIEMENERAEIEQVLARMEIRMGWIRGRMATIRSMPTGASFLNESQDILTELGSIKSDVLATRKAFLGP